MDNKKGGLEGFEFADWKAPLKRFLGWLCCMVALIRQGAGLSDCLPPLMSREEVLAHSAGSTKLALNRIGIRLFSEAAFSRLRQCGR